MCGGSSSKRYGCWCTCDAIDCLLGRLDNWVRLSSHRPTLSEMLSVQGLVAQAIIVNEIHAL